MDLSRFIQRNYARFKCSRLKSVEIPLSATFRDTIYTIASAIATLRTIRSLWFSRAIHSSLPLDGDLPLFDHKVHCLPFYLASRPPISGRVALWITALCLRDACIDAGSSRPILSFIELPPWYKNFYTRSYIFHSISFFCILRIRAKHCEIARAKFYFIPITRRRFINVRDVIIIRNMIL